MTIEHTAAPAGDASIKTAGPAGDLIPERFRSPFPVSAQELREGRPVVLDRPAEHDLKDLPGAVRKRLEVALDHIEDGTAQLEPKQRELTGVFSVRLTRAWRALFYMGRERFWHMFAIVDHNYDEVERRWVASKARMSTTAYQMRHRPDEDGPPLHDMLQGEMMPDDVYEHPEHYGPPGRASQEIGRTLRQHRGKPDSMVTIYRAQPQAGGSTIRHGDWVALRREYAETHAKHSDDPSKDMPVLSAQVKAKDVRFALDYLEEWGYFGPDITAKKTASKTGAKTAAQDIYYHVTSEQDWPSIRENGLRARHGKVWLWDNIGHALHYSEMWGNPAVPPIVVVVKTSKPVTETFWGDAYTVDGSISPEEIFEPIRQRDFHHYDRELTLYRNSSKTARADRDGWWYHYGAGTVRFEMGEYVHLGTRKAALQRYENVSSQGWEGQSLHRAKIRPRNPLGSLSQPLTDAHANVLTSWEDEYATEKGQMPAEGEGIWYYGSEDPVAIAKRYGYKGAWTHDAVYYTNTVEDPGSVSVAVDPDCITARDTIPMETQDGQLMLWGSKTASTAWHLAPTSARDDIEAHGLDWRRSGKQEDPRSQAPLAIYFSHTRAEAEQMTEAGDVDLYEVDISGLSITPDPYQPEDAFYTREAIPSSRIRRVAGQKEANASRDYLDMINKFYEMQGLGQPENKYPSVDAMIRQRGKAWNRVADEMPSDIKMGDLGDCYQNAFNVAMNSRGKYIYVEGYASSGIMPLKHAWVVDGNGTVYDPTWHGRLNGGKAEGYFGVPIDLPWLMRFLNEQGYYGAFAGDIPSDGLIEILRHGLPDQALQTTGSKTALQEGVYYHVTTYANWPSIRDNGLTPGHDGHVWLFTEAESAMRFKDAWDPSWHKGTSPETWTIPPCIVVVRTDRAVPTEAGIPGAYWVEGPITKAEIFEVIRPGDMIHYSSRTARAESITYTVAGRTDWDGDRLEPGVGLVYAMDGEVFVGALHWDYLAEPPVITSVVVEPDYQRKGVATRLLEMARANQSGLVHSDSLTPDGRAWSERVGAKQPPATLYHYTSQAHFESIKRDGKIRTTESNIEMSGAGPRVVWLTTNDSQDGLGLYGKGQVRLEIKTPRETAHWPTWSFEQGIQPYWYAALESASNGNPETWWVCPREISLDEVVSVEVLGKPSSLASKTAADTGDDLGDFIVRGLSWHVSDYDLAKKIRDGRVTAREVISGLEPLGVWWGLPLQYSGGPNDLSEFEYHAEGSGDSDLSPAGAIREAEEAYAYWQDPKRYEEVGDPSYIDARRKEPVKHHFAGCDLPVVLIAERPKIKTPEGDAYWDPAKHNESSGFFSGNSYLPNGFRMRIREVRIDPEGNGRWKSLGGRGITSTAMPVGPPPPGVRYLFTSNSRGNRKSTGTYCMLGAFLGDRCIGYLTWGLQGRKIQDIWVDPEFRRRRIAETMLTQGREVDPSLTHHPDRSDAGDAWARAVSGGDVEDRENNTVEEKPRNASGIIQRLLTTDPRDADNVIDVSPGEDIAKVALPSWRDRGRHPEAEAIIAPDTGRARNNSFMVYLYGEPHARRPSLAEAKATVEEIYGDLDWMKVKGDKMPHNDPTWGPTTMFNDAEQYYIVERLPRLGATAATHIYQREQALREQGILRPLSKSQAESLLVKILVSEGFPQGHNAEVEVNGGQHGKSQVGWYTDTIPMTPLVSLDPRMMDEMTLIHECAHIIRNGPEMAGKQATGEPHDEEFLKVFERLANTYGTYPTKRLFRTAGWEPSEPIVREMMAGGEKVVLVWDEMARPALGAKRRVIAYLGKVDGRRIGWLAWDSRSIISGVVVFDAFQRRGIATAMLEVAREVDPNVQHSHALTEDGQAWSEKVAATHPELVSSKMGG